MESNDLPISDEQIEAEILTKGMTAPRVLMEQVEGLKNANEKLARIRAAREARSHARTRSINAGHYSDSRCDEIPSDEAV